MAINLFPQQELDPLSQQVQTGIGGPIPGLPPILSQPGNAGGIMGALRGIGQKIRSVDPATWAMIAGGIGSARGGSPIGNVASGISQGLGQAQAFKSLKEKAQERQEARAERKFAGDELSKSITEALKNLDTDADGIVTPAEQERGNILRAALPIARLDPTRASQMVAEASNMLAPQEETSPIGQISPGQYDPASIDKFRQTGNFSDLKRYEPERLVTIAGVPHRLEPETGTLTPVSDIGSVAGNAATVAGATEEAKQEERRLGGLRTQLPKARSRVRMIKARREKVVLPSIDKALAMLDDQKYVVAGPGGLLSWVAGSPPKDFQELLRPIKSNIGFDQLQQLRADSPTGGAVGNVSDFENRELQAVLGSLEQTQSPTQLRETLSQIREMLTLSMNDLEEALQMDYGEILPKTSAKTEDGWSLETAD